MAPPPPHRPQHSRPAIIPVPPSGRRKGRDGNNGRLCLRGLGEGEQRAPATREQVSIYYIRARFGVVDSSLRSVGRGAPPPSATPRLQREDLHHNFIELASAWVGASLISPTINHTDNRLISQKSTTHYALASSYFLVVMIS